MSNPQVGTMEWEAGNNTGEEANIMIGKITNYNGQANCNRPNKQ
jgi:hypothetical protein